MLPGVYQVSVLGSAVTILCEGDSVVLLDAGLRTSPRRVSDFLGAQGLSLRNVTHILVTHCHPDHIGGLAALKETTGAQVGAHPLDAPYVCGVQTYPAPFVARTLNGLTSPLFHLTRPRPVVVDIALEDGFRLDFLGGLEVIHTPGHTLGSISVYLPALGLLHVGDALESERGRLELPSQWFTQDMNQAKESIERLSHLAVETISFSHYPPMRKEARIALQELVERFT